MITCCRRVPDFISKNIRAVFTFTAVPQIDRKWLKQVVDHSKSGRTKAKGFYYKMFRVRENVRVLLINNQNMKDAKAVHFAIRIGAGSEDEDVECQGLAHLLEHVVGKITSNLSQTSSDCETGCFDTVYTLSSDRYNFAGTLKTWSRFLFSTSGLQTLYADAKTEMKIERQCIDNEFHETRLHTGIIMAVKLAVEILKSEGMFLANFNMGNLEVFSRDNDDAMMKRLDDFRGFYRQRPVNICIYSKQELDTETIFESLNGDCHFLQTGKATEAPLKKHQQSHKNISERVIVLKSVDDRQQLSLLFPLNKKLSCKELNALRFISEMIATESEGSLSRHFIDNELATACYAIDHLNTYFITVDLTEIGLEKIRTVDRTVRNYLEFLHREWTKFDELQYRKQSLDSALETLDSESDLKYAKYLTTFFDGKDDEFDDTDLFETLDRKEEQQLVSEQILNNKNIVRMIVHRDPDRVFHTLRAACGNVFQSVSSSRTEPIHGVEYCITETKLFEVDVEDAKEFTSVELLDLRTLQPPGEERIAAFIDEPEYLVFQNLCVKYTTLETSRYHTTYVSPDYTIEDGTVMYNPNNHLDERHFNSLSPFGMASNKFNFCKQHFMRTLAVEMTNSEDFAMSLMETAVRNVHNKRKGDPVPMQYNALMEMTSADYNHYFAELLEPNHISRISEKIVATNEDRFNEAFTIESINNSEQVTATLLFGRIPETVDESTVTALGRYLNKCILSIKKTFLIYNAKKEIENFDDIRGFLIKIISVESKDFQKSKHMLQHCNTELINLVKKDENHKKLRALYNDVMERKIVIEVKGHAQCGANESDFGNQFRQWFELNENKFKKFKTIPNRK